jgi:hypothetical protein
MLERLFGDNCTNIAYWAWCKYPLCCVCLGILADMNSNNETEYPQLWAKTAPARTCLFVPRDCCVKLPLVWRGELSLIPGADRTG